MKRPPDDYFDMNEIALEIITELAKIYDDEDDWMDCLMIALAKIIYHAYIPEHHEQFVNNLCKSLKFTLKNVKMYNE